MARRLAALSVHVLTASGAALGVAALVAAIDGRTRSAFVWLLAALVVDGIDGPLARRVRVDTAVPSIDGALLDNVVDYLTYVVVPAVILHGSSLLPAGVALLGAAWICFVSAIQFAHVEAKTDDGLFRGFPSCWNVVVLYLCVIRPSAAVTLVVLGALGVLALAPVYFVYPNRTPILRRATLAMTVGWIAALVAIVAWYPSPASWIVYLSLVYVVYYAALSVALTARRRSRRLAA